MILCTCIVDAEKPDKNYSHVPTAGVTLTPSTSYTTPKGKPWIIQLQKIDLNVYKQLLLYQINLYGMGFVCVTRCVVM